MTATQTVNGPWNSKDLQQEKYTKDKKIVSTGAGPPEQIWKVEISPYLLLKCKYILGDEICSTFCPLHQSVIPNYVPK